MKNNHKMDGNSTNPQAELLAKLMQEMPEIFSEGKIDTKKLKATLGEDVLTDQERYGLTWAGKAECFKKIQETTTNTLKPCRDESVDFDKTENLFIEGDNLQVLKVLQKSYYGKVKMIYIDPPYNTGNDFIYNDKFSRTKKEELIANGSIDKEGNVINHDLYRQNTRDSGHFHSNWLNMMYPRLFLARNLLRQDGVIFVSINDYEMKNLRALMDEIFGEDNSLTEMPTALIWQQSGTTAGHFANAHEYILCYAKNKGALPFFKLSDYGEDSIISHGALKKISKANPASEIIFPAGIDFEGKDKIFEGEIGGSEKQYIKGKMIFKNGKLAQPVTIEAGWGMRFQILEWLAGQETFDTKDQRIIRFYFNKEGILCYEKERGTIHPKTILNKELVGTTKAGTNEIIELFNFKAIDYPKPVNLIKYFSSFSTESSDIIVDFFAGSGTTAHAVMQLNAEDGGNRKWICVQLPEKCKDGSEAAKAGFHTIADIAKERIRRAGKKIKESAKDMKIDLGFKTFKLDESNFKVWNTQIANVEQLEQQLINFIDNVRPESTTEDMLYELVLKSGLELNIAIEEKQADGSKYHRIGDGSLIICLADKLTKSLFEAILKDKPEKIITLDRAFVNNDQLKTNMMLEAEHGGVKEFKVI